MHHKIIEKQLPPKSINELVVEFCSYLCCDKKPLYVQIEPEKHSKPLLCYLNVEKKVKHDGGTSVFGWSIAEYRDIFLEAQHHAIWRSQSGNLMDITPAEFGNNMSLFLEDPHRSYIGLPIPSERYSLADPVKVNEFISLLDTQKENFYKLLQSGAKIGDPVYKKLSPLSDKIQAMKKEIRKNA